MHLFFCTSTDVYIDLAPWDLSPPTKLAGGEWGERVEHVSDIMQ